MAINIDYTPFGALGEGSYQAGYGQYAQRVAEQARLERQHQQQIEAQRRRQEEMIQAQIEQDNRRYEQENYKYERDYKQKQLDTQQDHEWDREKQKNELDWKREDRDTRDTQAKAMGVQDFDLNERKYDAQEQRRVDGLKKQMARLEEVHAAGQIGFGDMMKEYNRIKDEMAGVPKSERPMSDEDYLKQWRVPLPDGGFFIKGSKGEQPKYQAPEKDEKDTKLEDKRKHDKDQRDLQEDKDKAADRLRKVLKPGINAGKEPMYTPEQIQEKVDRAYGLTEREQQMMDHEAKINAEQKRQDAIRAAQMPAERKAWEEDKWASDQQPVDNTEAIVREQSRQQVQAGPTQPVQQNNQFQPPVYVGSAEEAASLPSGTRFIGPSGRIKVVP